MVPLVLTHSQVSSQSGPVPMSPFSEAGAETSVPRGVRDADPQRHPAERSGGWALQSLGRYMLPGWGKIWFKHHLCKGIVIITSGLNMFKPMSGFAGLFGL